jgi:flagellum-specific peptidoglycan hydrolase FlgJ
MPQAARKRFYNSYRWKRWLRNREKRRNEGREPKIHPYEARFVSESLHTARLAEKKYGVSAEALLTLSAIETDWGRGLLKDDAGVPSNNYFMLPADLLWPGEVVYIDLPEKVGPISFWKTYAFRRYYSRYDSYLDFILMLKTNAQFKKALERHAAPRRFLAALRKLGYLVGRNPNGPEDKWQAREHSVAHMKVVKILKDLKELRGDETPLSPSKESAGEGLP